MKKKSSYEILVEQWLERAKTLGYVSKFKYEPETFLLFPKEGLFREITYTPDFKVWFTDKFYEDFPNTLKYFKQHHGNEATYIDVKSVYNGIGNSSNREFPYNQRLMWEKYGIYVEKILVDGKKSLFYYTFVSEEMALYKRDKTKVKKMFKGMKIL